jgi:hypothetical protein
MCYGYVMHVTYGLGTPQILYSMISRVKNVIHFVNVTKVCYLLTRMREVTDGVLIKHYMVYQLGVDIFFV